jgi:hypothetical protein
MIQPQVTPQHSSCPISCDLLTDPLRTYGHHTIEEAILGWLSEGMIHAPLTRNLLDEDAGLRQRSSSVEIN